MATTQGSRIAAAIGAVTLAVVGLYLVFGRGGGQGKEDKRQKEGGQDDQGSKALGAGGESGSGGEAKDPEKLKKKGNNCFSEGKFEEAIALYSEAIGLNPGAEDMSKYYANRAACYARLKKYDEVVADCTKALELDPGYVKALHRRAQAYESLDRLDDAVKDYARGVRLQPNVQDHQAMSNSADLLLQRIAQKKAKEKLKEKMGQFPTPSLIKTYLSTFKPKEVTESIKDLKAAAESDGLAAYKLGLRLMATEKYSEALASFTKAVELDPSLAAAHTEQGTLLHLSGEVLSALESFAKAVELDPTSVDAHVKWANALFFVGEVDKANAMLDKAIELDPTDTVGYFHAAQAMTQQENHAKAIEYFTKVIDIDPQHYAALNHRGMAYASTLEKEVDPLTAQHSVDMAMQDYENAIRVKPSEPDAYNSYGVLLRVLGRTKDALHKFDQAIQVAPKSATAYTNKGFHKLHLDNDKEAAKKLFTKALEVDPTFIEALCNLAIIYLETSIDEAVKCYDRAIELSFFEQDLTTIYTFREAALLSKEIGVARS